MVTQSTQLNLYPRYLDTRRYIDFSYNSGKLEIEFWNGVGSIPVGGNSPSIYWWIV